MPSRPRPRPKIVPSSSGAEASSPKSKKTPVVDSDSDDDMFIRNKGRSLRDVNKRLAKKAAIARTVSPSESEGENEEDTPKQHRANGRVQGLFGAGKQHAQPKWAKKGAIQSLLVDSDESKEDGDSPKRRQDDEGTPLAKQGKRVRTRSRSRSLTPPPDLTEAERLRVHRVIQNAWVTEQNGQGNARTPLHPLEAELDDGDECDGGDGIALDPELENIALAIHKRALATKTRTGANEMHAPQHHGPAAVIVRVKWILHPENDAIKGDSVSSWTFTVDKHDSLKELFLQTSDKARIMPQDLVLMRSGRQVFPGVTPQGLGVWDQLDLEACDRSTFEALRSRHFRSPTPATNEPDPDREASPRPSEVSVEHDAEEKFKLVLRAPGTKEITLNVKPSTTCGKIVRAFMAVIAKHSGAIPASPRKAAQVRLCVDGEKQDPDTPISTCDLEDGDMVEVVGM